MVFLLLCFCLLVLFFLLPKATSICYPTQSCQKNETCSPFLTTNSVVKCDHNELEIRLEDGIWRPVKDIDYNQKTLTVLDQELGNILDPETCNFLYIFDPPFRQFFPPPPKQFKNRTTCSFQDNQYFQTFLPEFYNLFPCRNYSAYYWNKWKDNSPEFSSTMCEVNTPRPPLVFVLSFHDANRGLSLLSFGFSAHLKLQLQCFNVKLCSKW